MTPDDAGTSPAGEGRRSAYPGADPRRSKAAPAGSASNSAGPSAPGAPTAAGKAAAGAQQDARPGRLAALLGATTGGLMAGIFGTLLHAHIVDVGGTGLPLGALGALVLAFSIFLLCGLWARNILTTAVAGAAAYVVVAVLSTSRQVLILTGSSDAAPAVSLAGNLWLFGVVVMTIAAIVVTSAVLRASHIRSSRGG